MNIDTLKALSYEHPIIAYDGHCILCNGFIQRMLHLDRAGIIKYTTIDSDVGQALVAQQNHQNSIVLLVDGIAYNKSTAVIIASRYLPTPHSWLYSFRYIPRFFRDTVYNIVARNRYSLGGRNDQCPIPDPKYKNRFLN